MAPPGRQRRREDHEFAQQLDLARREHGLNTADLAKALYCSDRTVRRYLSAERRPSRETVVRWEEACGASPGRLTELFDKLSAGAPFPAPQAQPAAAAMEDDAASPPREVGRRRARPWLVVALAASVIVALTIGLLVRLPDNSRAGGDDPGWDRKDPQESGCSRTPELLASAPVNVAGRRRGTLELKGSTSCQTAWARLVLFAKGPPPVTVVAVRPSDHARASYTYRKSARIVFGGMLKRAAGCVYAEATFAHERARTRCTR